METTAHPQPHPPPPTIAAPNYHNPSKLQPIKHKKTTIATHKGHNPYKSETPPPQITSQTHQNLATPAGTHPHLPEPIHIHRTIARPTNWATHTVADLNLHDMPTLSLISTVLILS